MRVCVCVRVCACVCVCVCVWSLWVQERQGGAFRRRILDPHRGGPNFIFALSPTLRSSQVCSCSQEKTSQAEKQTQQLERRPELDCFSFEIWCACQNGFDCAQWCKFRRRANFVSELEAGIRHPGHVADRHRFYSSLEGEPGEA